MTKRAYHHGNLRETLVKVALRAIAEHGPDGFTLRDVARRAGVSAPAVYRHFRDRDDLLVAVAAECAERLGAVMAESVARAPADPLERFRATGIAYVRFAVANPEHFRAIGVPGLVERIPAEQRARQEAWHAAERQGLIEAQRSGLIADMPLDELMLAASSLTHGLAHQIVEGRLGEVDDARATELAIAATRVLGLGLIPRETAVVDPQTVPASKPARAKRTRAATGI